MNATSSLKRMDGTVNYPFKAGAVEATKVGALSKSQLVAFLDSHL